MALIWFDGYDTYNTKYDWVVVENPNISFSWYNESFSYFSTTAGRFGGGCLSGQHNWSKYIHSLTNTYATLIIGFAIYIGVGNTPIFNGLNPFIVFYDTYPDNNSYWQVALHMTPSREIEVYNRYGQGSLLGTTSGLNLVPLVWHYLEIKVTIHNTNGSIVIKKNGKVELNLTSVDTQYSANAYTTGFFLASVYDNLLTLFDDLYICDTSGSKNNDFLGDVRIDTLRPSGVGTYSQFTPSEATNWQGVDDDPGPDDDTSYNDGTTPGNKDSYAFEDISSLGTPILAVKSQITTKKTDAGSKMVKILTRSGSSDYLSETTGLSDTYTTPAKVYEDNPDDSNDWQEADVNAMELGIQIVTTTTSTTTTSTTSTTTTTA